MLLNVSLCTQERAHPPEASFKNNFRRVPKMLIYTNYKSSWPCGSCQEDSLKNAFLEPFLTP